MPFTCGDCIKMNIEDGLIEREYDFAEDALDFEETMKFYIMKRFSDDYESEEAEGYFYDNSFGSPEVLETQLADAKEVAFTQPLASPLAIGSHILCTGTPDDDIPWFAVNIGCGGDADSGKADVALHINARMPQHYVVRNTRRNGSWGVEETTAFSPFPFKEGRPFTIELLIDETETMVAVDGQHYCSYAHRNPSPFTAGWIQVTGVRDAALNVTKADVYPMLAPEIVQVPTRKSYGAATESDEPTWRANITAALKNGIPEGYQLVIQGSLRPILHSFSIDLLDGTSEWPRPNIHFHANLRAHASPQQSRQLLVMNARLGAWGTECRQRSARLVPQTTVTLRVSRGASSWQLFAHDSLLGELPHRASPAAVKALRVRGDLRPNAVYLCPAE